MTSRITVTQKGRGLQKEMLKETKFELPPVLNFNSLSQSRDKIITQVIFPTTPDALDESATLADNPFNSTLAFTRSGYFGPKKKIITYQENLSKIRPRYYPNYLRASVEDYPNSHFKILTADHPLKHISQHQKLVSPKQLPGETIYGSDTYKPLELTSPHRLPIKYTHHTIFPLTRSDRPSFLKTQNNSKFNESIRLSQNESSSPIKIETSDTHMIMSPHDSKRFEINSQRQQELQRTMYLDKTIVSDHYSGKIVSKYTDKKLDRMMDRHKESQKEFAETLKLVEEKYKAKMSRHDENMHEAPDFLKEMKKREEIFVEVKKKYTNEDARFKQRIKNMHNTKYTDFWKSLQSGRVANRPVQTETNSPGKVQRQITIEFVTRTYSKNGSIEENQQNLADNHILPQTFV